jgi:hypothetical protein
VPSVIALIPSAEHADGNVIGATLAAIVLGLQNP